MQGPWAAKLGPFALLFTCISQYLADLWFDLLWLLGLRKKVTVMLLGLDNSGKSTLRGLLETDRITIHCPTIHPEVEKFHIGPVRFTCIDPGGIEFARKQWPGLVASHRVQCAMFLVDAPDKERFQEVNEVFTKFILENPTLPCAVFFNKSEMIREPPEDREPHRLAERVGIQHFLEPGSKFRVKLFGGDVVRRRGYQQAFEWLASTV